MDNVHRDYLLKRFREERDETWKRIAEEVRISVNKSDRIDLLTRLHNHLISVFSEIEIQIQRAFDDMEKEGGAP